MDVTMGDSFQQSPARLRARGVCNITPDLISEISGTSISNLARLQTLDLNLRDERRGKIRKIENLLVVPNLRHLNLSYNAITKIEGLGRLHNLIELNLAENDIRVIENLESLRALERLNLSGNQIRRIPDEIAILQRLTTLRIARNRLDTVEDLMHLSGLRSLTKLRIDENPFSALETTPLFAIFCVSSLTHLDNVAVTERDRQEAHDLFGNRPPPPAPRPTTPTAAPVPAPAPAAPISAPSPVPPATPAALHPASTPVRYGSPLRTALSAVHTPQASSGGAAVRMSMLAGSPAVEAAAQQIGQLQERLEVVTSKLLASDREKNVLKEQLAAERGRAAAQAEAFAQQTRVAAKELEIVQQENNKIRRETMELRRTIEENDAVVGSRTSSSGDGAELQRLRDENAQLHRDLERAKHEATIAQDAKAFATQEADTLRRTVAELRRALSEREAQAAADALSSRYTGAAMDQWSAHESRVQVAAQRGEIETLRQEVTRLHRDLEQSMRETTAANEARLVAVQEAEQLRGRLSHSEEVCGATRGRLAEAESEVRRLTSRLSDAETARTAFEQECVRLTTSLAIMEAEMAALLKAKEATPRKAVTFRSAARGDRGVEAGAGGGSGATRLFQSPIRLRSEDRGQAALGAAADLYELASTGSEDNESEDSGAVQPGRLTASAVKAKRPRRSGSSALEASVVSSRPLYGTYAEPQKFSVSDLEVAAAEVIALVLMQEIEANAPAEVTASTGAGAGSTGARRGASRTEAGTKASAVAKSPFLKDACIRAALRVVHSSTTLARERLLEERQQRDRGTGTGQGGREDRGEGCAEEAAADVSRSSGEFDGISESKRSDQGQGNLNRSRYSSSGALSPTSTKGGGGGKGGKGKLGKVEVHPFQALGDHAFLCRVVADMHAGIAAIEDADAVKEEMRQTETVIRDLEVKALSIEGSIASKQHALATLEKHCDDAKSKSEQALNELEFLTQRLQEGRENITRAETEHNLLRRELELTRHAHQEELAMSEVEQHNLQAVRSRLVELKHELSETEQQLLVCKESALKEEDKLRKTKTLATDQLRLLQMDLNKIQSDFKARQRQLEDLEKHRRLVDEEIEIRKRDSDLQLSAASRELEEETRKLNNTKNDVRVGRLELEQLATKRRQLEGELVRLQDTFNAENTRCVAEEQELRRKLLQYEKQLQVADKQHRDLKGKISALEGEEVILRHSVEELRRQQGDMERAAEVRRRTTEEEVARAEHRAQVALRMARQADSDKEAKQAEVGALAQELRGMERRVDELRRQARELEMLLESRRDSVKVLETDHDRRQKDASTVRKEEEELRHQSQLLRASLEGLSRENEELKRRLATLKEEESSLKDSEMRMRAALQHSRKGVEEAQVELSELRAASERERRALADLRTKRSVTEAEMGRQEEALKFEAERVQQEALHRAEVEAATARCHEEAARSQKALALVEKRLEDAVRREDDLKRSETALKASMEKLRLEVETLSCLQTNEKSTVSTAREELREINLDIRRGKESLRVVQQEVQTAQLGLETLQAQRDHLESLKDELTAELNRIRESARQEMQRIDKLDSLYTDAEQRLKSVRADLTTSEQAYEQMRNLSAEEEQRVQMQRRSLRLVMDELAKVERKISEGHQQVYEERQKALVEIGQLSQAKQSAQAHMFLAAEAQRRLDSRAALPSYGAGLHPSRARDPSPDRLPSVLNIPDYLHSTNTSTLYRATPALATSGVKLDTAPTLSKPLRDARADLLAPPTVVRSVPPYAEAPQAAGAAAAAGVPVTSASSQTAAYQASSGSRPAVAAQAPSGREFSLSFLQNEVENLKLRSEAAMRNAGLSAGTTTGQR